MKFRHRDAPNVAAGSISLGPVRDHAKIDGDDLFEVDASRDDIDDVVERLEDAGHERVEECTCGPEEACDKCGGSAAGQRDDSEAEDDEAPRAADFTEEELVAMDRNELRSIAGRYDHINGNASGDKLTEELIAQGREEVEE